MRRGKGPKPYRVPVTLVISPDERYAEVTFKDHYQWVNGQSPKETRRAALDIAVGHAARLGRPVLVHAADSTSQWQLVATPTGVVRSAVAPGAAAQRRRGLLVTSVAMLVVLGIAGAGAATFRLLPIGGSETADAATTPSAAAFDARPVPPGFTREALWKLPLAPGTRPSVAPDGTAAAVIGADGNVAVIGADGVREWSAKSPLPPDQVENRLHIHGADGDHTVSLADSASLWTWLAEGGEPERYDLPEDAEVNYGGTAPMVLSGSRVLLPAGGELVEVDTPQSTAGLLAKGDSVLAASANGPWSWVGAEGRAREVEPEFPRQTTGLDRVLAASADHVIVRWAAAGGGRTVLAVHDADDGSVISSTAVAAEALTDARWVVGDGVGAYGPLVFDLKSGEGRLLGGFRPINPAGGTLYGERKGATVAVGRDGSPVNLKEGAARPWGLLDGHAVVMADDDLYALTPA